MSHQKSRSSLPIWTTPVSSARRKLWEALWRPKETLETSKSSELTPETIIHLLESLTVFDLELFRQREQHYQNLKKESRPGTRKQRWWWDQCTSETLQSYHTSQGWRVGMPVLNSNCDQQVSLPERNFLKFIWRQEICYF